MKVIDDQDKIDGARLVAPMMAAGHEPHPHPAMVDAGIAFGWRIEAGDTTASAMHGLRLDVAAWYGGPPSGDPRLAARLHIGDDEKIALAAVVVATVASHEQTDIEAALFDAGARFGQVAYETRSLPKAFAHVGAWLVQWYGIAHPWPLPDVTPDAGAVQPLQGTVRVMGKSFGDASGPRIVHGCSDFAALPKFHQDRDKTLRELDVIAQHVQYVRVLWRLNGWYWSGGARASQYGGGVYENANLTVDPSRDSWYDETLRGYLQACQDRGLRVNLSSGDMNNWPRAQMEDGYRRTAQIAHSVAPDLVWLAAATNEMNGTMDGGESDANIRTLEDMMRIWEQHCPTSLRAISDPKDKDRDGMRRLSGGNSTVALIHDVRWGAHDAIRRAFNTRYEGHPGKPIVQDEPTGPNGSPPYSTFTRQVYQPIEDHDDLLAIYTMHVITGQASTYFNDPALVSREPINATWGLKELPACWRQMEIPEDIGQGTPTPGHKADAPLRVTGSGAERADSMVRGGYSIGIISGGGGWRVKAGTRGTATAFTADGIVWEGPVGEGDVLPITGPTPTIVRIVS